MTTCGKAGSSTTPASRAASMCRKNSTGADPSDVELFDTISRRTQIPRVGRQPYMSTVTLLWRDSECGRRPEDSRVNSESIQRIGGCFRCLRSQEGYGEECRQNHASNRQN